MHIANILVFLFSLLLAGRLSAREFYAFSNGVLDIPFAEQAALLKQLGYQGISQVKEGGKVLQEQIEAYRKQDLKVLSIYLDAGRIPFPPETYAALGESGGMIELTVQKMEADTVTSIRELAIAAAERKVRVSLYPHHGFAIATTTHAIELAREVNHLNLGIMFNCAIS